MKKQEIAASLHRRFDSINKLCERIISSFAREENNFVIGDIHFALEDIHRYRVEIKKLKAFLHLCSAGKGEQGTGRNGKGHHGKDHHGKRVHLKLPSSIRNFYRLIGDIRNMQLQMQRVHDFFPDGGYRPLNYIKGLEQRAEQVRSEVARLELSSLLLTGEEDVMKEAAAQKINKHTATCYMQDILQSFRWLKSKRKDEQLHALRKTFKDLNYNRRLVAALWGKSLQDRPLQDMSLQDRPLQVLPDHTLTKELIALLGDNQDLCMALHYLQDVHARELSEGEYEQLIGMMLRLAAQKIRTKENLIEKLRYL